MSPIVAKAFFINSLVGNPEPRKGSGFFAEVEEELVEVEGTDGLEDGLTESGAGVLTVGADGATGLGTDVLGVEGAEATGAGRCAVEPAKETAGSCKEGREITELALTCRLLPERSDKGFKEELIKESEEETTG